MTAIIVGTILLLLGILFCILFHITDNYIMGFISIMLFIAVLVAPCCFINYDENVKIIAQDGKTYYYEQCYTEKDKNSITIRFKHNDCITFYNPIKVEVK